MKSHRFPLRMLQAALALVAAAVALGPAHGQAWRPDKPIELIAASGPGGNTDKLERNFWEAHFLTGRALQDFLAAEFKEQQEILGVLGLARQSRP